MPFLKKSIIILLLLVLWLANSQWVYAKEKPSSWVPKVSAASALLLDGRTGQIYYSKDVDKQRHPASTTKILTGILAIERGRLNEKVTVGKKAAGIYIGSTLDLQLGDCLTLGDLVKGALLVSANDSTVAIGEHIGGRGKMFIEMLNTKALVLGAVNSHFVNSNGYSKPNHYVTALDLARVTRYALKNPVFARIVATKESSLSLRSRKGEVKTINLRNTNKLLGEYPGVNGVKTGTTSAAGGCLVTSAQQGNRQLIAVILKSSSRYRDTIKLLDYGFKELIEETIIAQGQIWSQVPVTGGKTDQVQVAASRPVRFIVPIHILEKLEKRVSLPGSIHAPVAKGQKLGALTVSYKGNILGRTDLVAANEVRELSWWEKLY